MIPLQEFLLRARLERQLLQAWIEAGWLVPPQSDPDPMFSEVDLNQQQRLKCAFDDKGLLNPGKVFPTLHRCAELGRLHVHAGRVAFPGIPRF